MQNHTPNELDKQLEEQLKNESVPRYKKICELLFLMRNRNGHPLNTTKIAKPLIRTIANTSVGLEKPLNTLLKYVAYGQPEQVKALLDKHPELLLEKGNVVDPAGNTILGVSAYECALGAGDHEMVAIIREYFDKFEGGIEARIEQEKHYQDAIDNMLKQPAFDFSELMQIILDAPKEDITEELKNENDFKANYDGKIHPQYKKTLRQALEEFRQYFSPKEIKNGEMHFNYANLQKAFDLYNEKFDALGKASNGNWDKRDLFWRQVIGYIQRGLPACDRQAFAGGLYRLVEEQKPLKRRFKFKYNDIDFPITSGDLSRSGLGYEYPGRGAGWWAPGWSFFETYVKQKQQTCKSYTITPTRESSVCNFLN